jgi:uncharacterized protein (UPF0264 family)
MTKILASVMAVEEAHVALDCGFDLIDFKDPRAGALGALPLDTVRAGVRMIAGRRPTSATVGDLPMEPNILATVVNELAQTGVEFVKVGFFPSGDWNACIDVLPAYARSTRLVAVLFADRKPDFSWLSEFGRAGFAAVMVDTANKSARGLRHHLNDAVLGAFVTQAKSNGLMVGLAGSLCTEDIPDLLKLEPDYLGFRSALCSNANRTHGFDRARCTALRRLIKEGPAETHQKIGDCFVSRRPLM